MSEYFDYTDAPTIDYSPDDFVHVTEYFDFTTYDVDHAPDDLDFVTAIFSFEDPVDPSDLPSGPDFLYFDDVMAGGLAEGGDLSQILLSFRDRHALNPFNPRSIKGLDPGDLSPRYYTSVAGQKFYSLEQAPREITIVAGLNPNFSIHQTHSQLRNSVYKIATKSKSGRVDIYFANKDELVGVLTGFITKVETSPSNNDQIISITIVCDDPVIRSPAPLLIPTDTLGFTDLVIDDSVSTAPHGISFRVKFTADVPNLVITDPTDDSWEFRVLPIGGFNAGDILYFSSEFDRRLIRTSAANLMGRVTGKSIWPIIFPGANHLSFSNPSTLEWQQLSYYRAYWGV